MSTSRTARSSKHDTAIGDFTSVMPGVSVCGDCRIGEGVTLGTNSSIIQGRSVGDWSVVGAGAAVIRDVPAGATALGVPARIAGA